MNYKLLEECYLGLKIKVNISCIKAKQEIEKKNF